MKIWMRRWQGCTQWIAQHPVTAGVSSGEPELRRLWWGQYKPTEASKPRRRRRARRRGPRWAPEASPGAPGHHSLRAFWTMVPLAGQAAKQAADPPVVLCLSRLSQAGLDGTRWPGWTKAASFVGGCVVAEPGLWQAGGAFLGLFTVLATFRRGHREGEAREGGGEIPLPLPGGCVAHLCGRPGNRTWGSAAAATSGMSLTFVSSPPCLAKIFRYQSENERERGGGIRANQWEILSGGEKVAQKG